MTPPSLMCDQTGDAEKAYRTGLFACFMLGLLELPCVFLVAAMRRAIPRAAMMSALAGVSLTFISMTFAMQIFESPALAIVPMVVILVCYGSHVQLPFKIPAGLLALVLGAAIAWSLRLLGLSLFQPLVVHPQAFSAKHGGVATDDAGSAVLPPFLPKIMVGQVWEALMDPDSWPYLTVVLPMLMVNIVTNLSCVESAAAVGDDYNPTKVSRATSLDTHWTLTHNPTKMSHATSPH